MNAPLINSSALPALHQPPELSTPATRLLTCLVTAMLAWFAFTLTEHVLGTAGAEAFGTTTADLEANAAGGQWKNQLGFTLLGLYGGLAIVLPGGYRWRALNLLGLLLAANLLLPFVSVAWAVDFGLAARRLGVLGFCTLGAIGAARRLSLRDLCMVAVLCLAAWVGVGLLAEIALGTFKPWTSEWRFAGTMHPNAQGGNTAVLVLASWLAWRAARTPGWRMGLACICVGAFGLLIMTKSRTSCLALFAALAVIHGLRGHRPRTILGGIGMAAGGCALLLAVLLLQMDIGRDVADIILLGRNEHIGNLNGRTELWELLVEYASFRPWLGYGYRSFWTPDTINDVSDELFWGISSAHSIYIETVLSLGLLGLLLMLLLMLLAGKRAASLWMRTGDTGAAFLLGMLVYGAMDGFMESGFVAPSFLTWIAGCGLIRLGWMQTDSTDDGQASEELR